MDATELRAMQAPIKDRYKSDPGAALITLKAKGTLDDQNIACKVETGRALAVAGLHPATGGSGMELCSGDMLLEALVACAGVTLKAVSTALAIPLKSGTVSAEGDLDFRGTLGVDKEAPVGFRADPAALRCRNRRAAGQARPVAQAHRALLRGLSDHRQGPAGGHQDAAGVSCRSDCHASTSCAGLVPAIHVLICCSAKAWMAGTSPAMTDDDRPADVPRPSLLALARSQDGRHRRLRHRRRDGGRARRRGHRRHRRHVAGRRRPGLCVRRARSRFRVHCGERDRQHRGACGDRGVLAGLYRAGAAQRHGWSASAARSRSGSSSRSCCARCHGRSSPWRRPIWRCSASASR